MVFLLEGLRLWPRCNDIILISLGLMPFPQFTPFLLALLGPRRQGQSYHGGYPQTATGERFIGLFRLSFCMVSKPHFTVCPFTILAPSTQSGQVSFSRGLVQKQQLRKRSILFHSVYYASWHQLLGSSLPLSFSLLLNRKDAGHTPLST